MRDTEKTNEKVKEIAEKIDIGIFELFESEKFKEYLDTMSKFHNYSFNNTMLIYMQNPDATWVAGFKTWQNEFSRYVNKGEKGIQILAPIVQTIKEKQEKLDPDTKLPILGKDGKPIYREVKKTIIKGFKPAYVFDVSQTSGKELPKIGVDELRGNVDNYENFFAAICNTSPVPISFAEIASDAKGFYHHVDKAITIKENMSEIQNIKTVIHEIAHAKLHDRDLSNAEKDSHTKEVEAESIAYTVCRYFGIDTSEYSFVYVAAWSTGKELPELKSSLETIKATAAELIDTISENYIEIEKEKKLTAEISDKIAEKIRQNERDDEHFSAQLDKFITGEMPIFETLSLGSTPNILYLVGACADTLTMRQNVLQNSISDKTHNTNGHSEGHDIAVDTIKQLPEALRNPILLLNGQHPHTVIALTELKNKNEKNIVVPIALDLRSTDSTVNKVSSLYGKNNILHYLSKHEKDIIAINTKKADELFTTIGYRLSQTTSAICFDNSIAYSTENVKYPKENILPENAEIAEHLAEYIAFSANFSDFDVQNQMRIFAQNPKAQLVKSSDEWEKIGYRINQNATPIVLEKTEICEYFIDENGAVKEVLQASNREKTKIFCGEIKIHTDKTVTEFEAFDISQTDVPQKDYPKFLQKSDFSKSYGDVVNYPLSKANGLPVSQTS